MLETRSSDQIKPSLVILGLLFPFNTLLPRTVPEVREWQNIHKYRWAKLGEDDGRA